jgi:hypothetical protein
MTLQLLHLEFPYILGKFDFLFISDEGAWLWTLNTLPYPALESRFAISFLFDDIFDDRAEKCYISQCWFSLHADFYLLFNIIMMTLHGGKQ